jgi:hypothetical protein
MLVDAVKVIATEIDESDAALEGTANLAAGGACGMGASLGVPTRNDPPASVR